MDKKRAPQETSNTAHTKFLNMHARILKVVTIFNVVRDFSKGKTDYPLISSSVTKNKDDKTFRLFYRIFLKRKFSVAKTIRNYI